MIPGEQQRTSLVAERISNGFWTGLSLGVYLGYLEALKDGDDLVRIFGTAIIATLIVGVIIGTIMKFSVFANVIIMIYAGLAKGAIVTMFLSLWPFGVALRDRNDKWFWIVAGVLCVWHWFSHIPTLSTFAGDRAAERYLDKKQFFENMHPGETYMSEEEKEEERLRQERKAQWKAEKEREQKQEAARNAAEKWFAGCSDLDSLNKRHKKLLSMYHPDAEDGDAEISAEINIAYEEMKSRF